MIKRLVRRVLLAACATSFKPLFSKSAAVDDMAGKLPVPSQVAMYVSVIFMGKEDELVDSRRHEFSWDREDLLISLRA